MPWWTSYSHWETILDQTETIVTEVDGETVETEADSISASTASRIQAACYPGKYEGDTWPTDSAKSWYKQQFNTDFIPSDEVFNAWYNDEDTDPSLKEDARNHGWGPHLWMQNKWGVWFNEDLNTYFNPPGPGGPGPDTPEEIIYMHFTTDFRFGETIDARGQKANATSPTNFDEEKQYVVVGSPRWFADSVPYQENLSTERVGAVFVFDSMYTTDVATSRVNGGTSSQIKRIIPTPNNGTTVGAMEVDTIPWNEDLNELEQNFYDADAVSVHFQMELYEQSDLVNRGSPSFWPSLIYDNAYFDSDNVTFTWPEPAEMLHSDGTDAGGISAKGFMTFGEAPEASWIQDNADAYDNGGHLGYIKLGKNSSYSMNEDDLTIEFWWKLTSEQSAGNNINNVPLLAYMNASEWTSNTEPDLSNAWTLTYDKITKKITFQYTNESNDHTLTSGVVDTNAWYHIALVHEKRELSDSDSEYNQRRFQLYINGNPQGDSLSDSIATQINDETEGTYTHNLFIGGVKSESDEFGVFTWSFQDQQYDDIRITHGVRYKQLMTDGDNPTEIGFTTPTSAFEICYHEKGHGADVAMDADYDIFILNNNHTGYIEKQTNTKYAQDLDTTLVSSDWEKTDVVTLAKEVPLIGGEISVYDQDLVYGNLNDLRIFPRNEGITISDTGNNEPNTSNANDDEEEQSES